MKQRMKQTLALLLCALLLVGAVPAAGLTARASSEITGTYGDLSWSLDTDSGELYIFGTGSMPYPDGVGRSAWYNYADYVKTVRMSDGVESISDCAFSGCRYMTSITIGSGVRYIGLDAFNDCKSLTTVTIPDNVVILDGSVFDECDNLTSVTIGSGVTWMYYDIFRYCPSLTTITVSEDNASFSSDENGVLFNKDKTELICYPQGSPLTSFVIPDSVTEIGSDAFIDSVNLQSVTFGSGLTTVSETAFNGCTNLVSVTVCADNPVLSSDENCMLYNKDKTTLLRYLRGTPAAAVTIRDGVTQIGKKAFTFCDGLESVVFPDSLTRIDGDAFHSCYDLESVTFTGNDLKAIGDDAFAGCYDLEDMAIPDGVGSIGSNAFYYCVKLANVTLPDSVRTIGSDAFAETAYYRDESNWTNDLLYLGRHLIKARKTVSDADCIAAGTITIAADAFSGCPSLTQITIPDGVQSIGDNAFRKCSALQFVHIPRSVTAIGSGILTGTAAYICSDTEDCAAKAYAEANDVEFRVCTEQNMTHEHDFYAVVSDAVVGCSTGRLVRVNVELQNNPGIVSTRLHIGYDPQILCLVEVQNGGVFAESTFTAGGDLSKEPYTVLWIDALTREDNTANGTLVTLTFEVQPTATVGDTAVTVTCDAGSTRNSALQRIPMETVNGTVSVVDCTPGDPDGDGEVTLGDVAVLCRALAGGWDVTVNAVNGDVDGDGDLDLKDVILLRRYLAGGWDVVLK